MTLVELPNGVDSTYSYDDADRLTGIDHVHDTTSLAFVQYTLDKVGNRVERVDGAGTHVYGYDDVYRLTSVTYPGPSTTTYSYDDFGNRTSMTVDSDTTTYVYDDADRLTSLTPPGSSAVAYDWDDNGNLVERGSDTFVWDFENRLLEVTVDSTTTAFTYRGDGLRDSRTVGMNTTTFTWDIVAGIPVVIDDGDLRYVYGAHGLIAQKSASDDYYLLSDGLGSTMAITDDQGAVVRDYQYDVFGEVTGGSGSAETEFQFAGEQVDGSTGLQYLRNRYYDMETGRFISRDPLSAMPGWVEHPYMYANANPVNLVDPLGQVPDDPNRQCRLELDDTHPLRCPPVAPPPPPLPPLPDPTKVASGLVKLVGEYFLEPLGETEKAYLDSYTALSSSLRTFFRSAHNCASDEICAALVQAQLLGMAQERGGFRTPWGRALFGAAGAWRAYAFVAQNLPLLNATDEEEQNSVPQ